MFLVQVKVTKNELPKLERMQWTRFYGRMAAYYQREMGAMFATQGASRGHAWTPLAESTKRQKAKAGKTPDILVRNGLLRASFRALELNRDHLRFGTDVKSAVYHDSDQPRKQKSGGGPRLPMRPLIRVIPRDIEKAEDLASREVGHALGQEGL